MYLVNPMFETPRIRGMRGLGDASATPVRVDTTDILNLGDSLRNAQARLTNIVEQMKNSAELARAIGADVTRQQAALGDLTAKYVGVYTAIFGQPPAGLGNPLLVAAAVAVILGYVTAQLYLWHQKQDVLEQQAQAQVLAEQNRASIISMAQQKQAASQAAAAAGDAVGAADEQAAAMALLQQAGVPGTQPPPPPGTQSFGEWIKANWLIVAGISAAVIVLPRIVGGNRVGK